MFVKLGWMSHQDMGLHLPTDLVTWSRTFRSFSDGVIAVRADYLERLWVLECELDPVFDILN